MTQPQTRPGRHLVHTHQPPVHAPNAALLIDFDNVTLGIRSDLTKELRTLLNSDIIKGKVAVQRAYADWRRYPQYIVPLSELSIDLIFAPAFGATKKNATDIRLAIDAIELVFTRPEIGTFIIMSGDSDFSTMVIKLKEYGKYVIGVGIRESASDLLIQNCDEYYSYSDLAGLTKEVDLPSVQRDPWELAQEAVAQMVRNGDVMRSDRLKQVMQQIDPNFDEKNAGFSRFSKFVLEAGQRGILQVSKMDNGQYEVAPAGAAPAPAAAPVREPAGSREPAALEGRARRGAGARAPAAATEPAREPAAEEAGRRRRGRGRERERPADRRAPGRRAEIEPRRDGALTLAGAFQLIGQALSELKPPVPHEALRLRMIALHGREDPLLEPGRFLRLLRQANDAEIADVRKVSDDEYEIVPHRAEAGAPPLPPAARFEPEEPALARAPAAAAPGNGQAPATPGLRFRRGSRGPIRAAEIPLIGVVQVDEEEERERREEPEGREERDERAPAERPRRAARPRARRGTKRARSAEAAAAAESEPAADALTEAEPGEPEPVAAEAAEPAGATRGAARRRSRPRARRKAE